MLMVEMVGMEMVETMDVLTRHSWLVILETMMEKVARILTDKAVRCGTLARSSEKRKEVEETINKEVYGKIISKAKVGKGFVAIAPPRNENVDSYSKCAKCSAYHPESGPCRLCFNCQKPSHFARECRPPVKQVAPISAVIMGNNQRVCYKRRRFERLRNTCPRNQARGRAFSVKAVDALLDPNVLTEIANGKKEEVDRIVRDCKIELGNSLFIIDLIPLGHESFDVIMRMDWLSKNKADIACHEKTKEDHEIHLKLVLELLKKERLFARLCKCEFRLQEVHFLGHVVNHNAQSEAFKEENVPTERLHGLDQQMERKEDERLYFMDHI
nr:hypothetical protein [Tanacetum cinerariifolium]